MRFRKVNKATGASYFKVNLGHLGGHIAQTVYGKMGSDDVPFSDPNRTDSAEIFRGPVPHTMGQSIAGFFESENAVVLALKNLRTPL